MSERVVQASGSVKKRASASRAGRGADDGARERAVGRAVAALEIAAFHLSSVESPQEPSELAFFGARRSTRRLESLPERVARERFFLGLWTLSKRASRAGRFAKKKYFS